MIWAVDGYVRAKQHTPLNGRCDRAADNTIEPVVVSLLRANLPFIDCATSALSADAIFGRQMLRKQAM